jgi:histone deacetylase 11
MRKQTNRTWILLYLGVVAALFPACRGDSAAKLTRLQETQSQPSPEASGPNRAVARSQASTETERPIVDEAACRQKVPIVFSHHYDISLVGLEDLHPFDTKKYGKIYRWLTKHCGLSPEQFHTPQIVSDADLLLVHTPEYLEALSNSEAIAAIAEMRPLSLLPSFLLRAKLLKPMKLGTGGTILGAKLAMTCGWAINLSGGYHHAKSGNGEGFCYFADIPIAVMKLWETKPILKVLVIDLDAHQGNGHESVFGDDRRVNIFDVYNGSIYPQDEAARRYIDYDYPLAEQVADDAYLDLLKRELPKAIQRSAPGLIIYNAGTDILELDPLGGLNITAEGIIQRDEFVFRQAIDSGIPILMVLSGGYTPESANIVSRSIENLLKGVLSVNGG